MRLGSVCISLLTKEHPMSAPPDPPPAVEAPLGEASVPSRRSALLIGLGGALVTLSLMAMGGLFWLTQGPDAALGIGGVFSLVDGDGKTVTEKGFRGKYMLVFFGYTFCPDVCPTTLNQVAEAMDRLGGQADQIVPIFISVDPKRDTPAVVKEFTTAFSPRLVGLTGNAEQLEKVARAFRVYFAERRIGSGPDDYTMDHSSILYLMGRDGRFIAPVRAEGSGEQIATDLQRLIGNPSISNGARL
ncbi:MAG: SCO family protein [Acetobacteraceae bacterium]|nr:SCO family protein [Acetobacteraceae bacterium]